MPRTVKVNSHLWNDSQFMSLSDPAKLAYFYLTTHPGMTAVGALRGTLPGLAAELGWSLEVFTEAFRELIDRRLADMAATAPLIWLPHFLEDNKAESPNVVKSWGAILENLPRCPEFMDLVVDLGKFVTGWGEAFLQAFAQAIRPLIRNPLPAEPQPAEGSDKTSTKPADDPESPTEPKPTSPMPQATGAPSAKRSSKPLPKPSSEPLSEPSVEPLPEPSVESATPVTSGRQLVEVPVPEALRHEKFLQAWSKWTTHCLHHRPEFNADTAQQQLELMAQAAVQKSVAIVEGMLSHSTGRINGQPKPLNPDPALKVAT